LPPRQRDILTRLQEEALECQIHQRDQLRNNSSTLHLCSQGKRTRKDETVEDRERVLGKSVFVLSRYKVIRSPPKMTQLQTRTLWKRTGAAMARIREFVQRSENRPKAIMRDCTVSRMKG